MGKIRNILKILLIAFAIAMVGYIVSSLLTSCTVEVTKQNSDDTENVTGTYEGDFYYHYRSSKVRGVINKIEYDGHEYIIFTDKSGIAITHNPDCPCNNRYE